MDNVTLLLFDEQRKQRLDVDINPRITSVQVITSVNRGYDMLQVGIAPDRMVEREGVRYGQLPEPIELKAWTRAELRIGGYLAFEGRLGPVSVPATALTINGYWQALAEDDWYASSDTTVTTGGEVIKDMLSSSYLSVKPGGLGEFTDPLSEHAPVEFDGRSVAEALAQIVSEGDPLGNDVCWFVWDDRRLWLMPCIAPAMPDYRMDIDPRKMQIVENPSREYYGVTVEFRASARSITSIDAGNTSVTVTHDLGVTPASSQVQAWALSDLGAGMKFYISNITSTAFDINLVAPERETGTATVASGATSVNVTHNLSSTPAANEIKITPTNSPTNDPGNWWVDNIGATTFRVNVRNDPGAGGATFAWEAILGDVMVATAPGATANFGWQVDAGVQRTDEATNASFQSEYGFVRRRKFPAGSMTLASAERIRDRLLQLAQQPAYSVRLRLDKGDVLYGPHGEPVAAYTCRAGSWAVFGNLPPLMAVSVRHDLTGERLDVDFGDPYPDFDLLLRRLARAEERRSRGIEPESGGGLA